MNGKMASLSFYNIGGFLSRVDLNKESPVIDLSLVTFIEPFALVHLGLFLRHHKSQGKVFTWVPPRDQKLSAYMERVNFYNRFGSASADEGTKGLYPFTSSTSLDDVIDIKNQPGVAEEIGYRLKELLVRNRVQVEIETTCYITEEIVDNFAQHSGEELAVMTVQWFPHKHWLSLAFGECGIGIRKSLAQNPKYSYLRERSDEEAILLAFKETVSRREQAGMGLSEVKEMVINEKGNLLLSSNQGYFAIREGEPWSGKAMFNLTGVQMEIDIPERQ